MVCAYLASEWGKDTPDEVAARLLELEPRSVGMDPSPGIAAIHATRSYLQVLSHKDQENEDEDETFGAERGSGVVRVRWG